MALLETGKGESEYSEGKFEPEDNELWEFLDDNKLASQSIYEGLQSLDLTIPDLTGISSNDLDELCISLQLSLSDKIKFKKAVNSLTPTDLLSTSVPLKTPTGSRKVSANIPYYILGDLNSSIINDDSKLNLISKRASFNMSSANISMTICGAGGVGKSCIAQMMNGNSFIDEYDPTVEDTYQQVIKIGDLDPINISILDTSGQEEFRSFRQTWLKNCDVILLVYSIVSYNSYEEIMQDWMNEIHDHARNAELIILVGNKADLKGKRTVQLTDGYKFAEMYDMMFIEVSAKTGYNMNLLVYSLMKQIEERGISRTKKYSVVDLESSRNTERPSRNKCCSV